MYGTHDKKSLKQVTREARGPGTRLKVRWNTKLPTNWPLFLRSDENKSELFSLIAAEIHNMTIPEGKEVISTLKTSVVANPERADLHYLDSDHQEADTRMFLHVADCVSRGMKNLIVRTVDSDVVILALYVYQHLHEMEEIWIAFGRDKHFRMIPIHAISTSLGRNICMALPMFHSLTGCDTVSAFFGHGKQSAWEALKTLPDSVNTLKLLTTDPPSEANIPHAVQTSVSSVIIKMYSLSGEDIDAARLEGHYSQVSLFF